MAKSIYLNSVETVDCGKLDDPEYGDVEFSSTTEGSKATYTCRKGYYLVGDSKRVCLYSKDWSGDAPICKRKLSFIHPTSSVVLTFHGFVVYFIFHSS